MSSMISLAYRGRDRLSRSICDDMIMPGAVISVRVVVPRAVIDVRVASGLGMIMLVSARCWFGEWIADVVWNRLAGTVISAVPHPAGQLSH
jgi:hypothetical protein